MNHNQLKLHAGQMTVFKSKARFRCVVAGRRWGKCVSENTKIAMSDGSVKNIQDVNSGDSILTINEKTYKLEGNKVVAVANNGVRETVTIKTKSGKVLCVTPNHPILIGGKWVDAGDVKSGDLAATPKATHFGAVQISSDGENNCLSTPHDDFVNGDVTWDEVISVDASDECQTYDLQIENNHNFVSNGLITHNTQLSKTLMIKAARIPRRKIWYVAPTYRMAKDIMWQEIQDAIPRKWIKKVNDTTMTIWLINGSIIALKGADNPDSLRGVGIDFLVLDEYQDMHEDTWKKALRPTLADTGGHALFIGTPKSYNLLYDVYMLGQDKKRVKKGMWQSWQFPTITSPFIPPEEIAQAREDMDKKSFEQEFEASFTNMSGRVYYPFDRNVHAGDYKFNKNLPIWVGQDFNIDPMSAVIMQPQPDGTVWIVDEIVLFGSNTEESVDEIERRYYKYRAGVVIFPDPAGKARQHARGETDLDIFRERGFKRIVHRAKHPPVADRVNCVNRMLRAADGKVRLYIDQRCRSVIESLEQTVYKKGSRDIDKTMNLEHSTDALGYCIELQFPMRRIEIAGMSI